MSNNSTAANEKCENVNINMLVSFRNYPMDRFHGHRLTEAISEIKCKTEDNITLEPIDVRTLENGKYEILYGHYYVAAAKKLGIKTIPVVIHENLNDDEALSLTSFLEPVGLLYRLNIDIFSSNYMESEGYIQHKDEKIHFEDGDDMALDEYIEHFLLTDQEVCKLYKSIYCMGNRYPLSEEECTDDAVAREIVCLTKPDYNNMIFSDLKKSMNSKEFEDLKFCIDGDAKDLAKIFTRRDGYIDQITDQQHLKL